VAGRSVSCNLLVFAKSRPTLFSTYVQCLNGDDRQQSSKLKAMDSHNHDIQTIPCPRCRRSMKLVRTIPKLGVFPELLIFSCPTCGEVETQEMEQAA
jgi:hypothetical protein